MGNPGRYLAAMVGFILAMPAVCADPGVRCVLVVPPNTKPWADAQKRLTLVLKDLQWWYSCQMEGQGYGPKTFSLETHPNGGVVVHVVRLTEDAPKDPDSVRIACVAAAERKLGSRRVRKGTILVIVYNDYIWRDRERLKVVPHGRGTPREWAFFTAWHYFKVCPGIWNTNTSLEDFSDTAGLFPPLHLRVMDSYFQSQAMRGRSMGLVACGHGAFAHEIGHAFGLHHPTAPTARVRGDLMTTDFRFMRGNFLAGIQNEFCCLSAHDAAVLDKNALFQPHDVAAPSTGASRSVGMRGTASVVGNDAESLNARAQRVGLAEVRVIGTGFALRELKNGAFSHSNRLYVWRNLPADLEGFQFTQTAGGVQATIRIEALTRGQVFVATYVENAGLFLEQGWVLSEMHFNYTDAGMAKMQVLTKRLEPGVVEDVPQPLWAGAIVIFPQHSDSDLRRIP